jgi:hypothetical protein
VKKSEQLRKRWKDGGWFAGRDGGGWVSVEAEHVKGNKMRLLSTHVKWKGVREMSHDWHMVNLSCVLISSFIFNLMSAIYSHHSHVQRSFLCDMSTYILLDFNTICNTSK